MTSLIPNEFNVREIHGPRLARIGDLLAPTGAAGAIWPSERLCFSWPKGDLRVWALFLNRERSDAVAYVVLREIPPGAYEVLDLATHPTFRRRGLMTKVWSEVLAGLEPRVGSIWLEVREDNDAARQFYREQGFHEVGFRPGYYRDGMGAFMLTLDAGG